jgi:hypothetical protein
MSWQELSANPKVTDESNRVLRAAPFSQKNEYTFCRVGKEGTSFIKV